MGVNDSEEVEMPNSQLGGVNAQAKDCRRHISKEAKEEQSQDEAYSITTAKN